MILLKNQTVLSAFLQLCLAVGGNVDFSKVSNGETSHAVRQSR